MKIFAKTLSMPDKIYLINYHLTPISLRLQEKLLKFKGVN